MKNIKQENQTKIEKKKQINEKLEAHRLYLLEAIRQTEKMIELNNWAIEQLDLDNE